MIENNFPVPVVLIKRNNHGERKRDILNHINSDKKFTDVTVASDDGNTIAAHKVILAYSSRYLYLTIQAENQIIRQPGEICASAVFGVIYLFG